MSRRAVMSRQWWRLAGLTGLGFATPLVHELAARALIDHGVAGALLAGGGGWDTVLAAAAFLLLRLACFVALAAVPAVLVGFLVRRSSDAAANLR